MQALTFRFFLFAILALTSTGLTIAQESEAPVKVFILAGQSNMQGHAHVRTLSWLAEDESNAGFVKGYLADDGTFASHEGVRISLLSANGIVNGVLSTGFGANEEKIGPELAFGAQMKKKLGGEPFLIIKTAWGGKSLHTDFRSPSAGPFEFSTQQLERFREQEKDINAIKSEKEKATGKYYRMMIDHVQKVLADPASVSFEPNQKFELSGFVWFQGWNDMVDSGVYPNRGKAGGYDKYSKLMSDFIRDVRKDLNAPDLPFVIGVMGVGGPTEKYGTDQQRHKAVHQGFRDAMAAPLAKAEFEGTVSAVLTEEYWDLELDRLVRERDGLKNDVRRRVKKGELPKSEQQAELQKLIQQNFSESDLATLEGGTSNAAYHYLGSAKIMLGIGKGFADSVFELMKPGHVNNN